MLPARQTRSTLPACLLQLRQQLHHVHAALARNQVWGDSAAEFQPACVCLSHVELVAQVS